MTITATITTCPRTIEAIAVIAAGCRRISRIGRD